jgi:hypothetical protein
MFRLARMDASKVVRAPPQSGQFGEFGTIIQDGRCDFGDARYMRALFTLMRCAGCGRAGMAKVYDNGRVIDGVLADFYPPSIAHGKLPEAVPDGIKHEFREAERCAAFGAYRAASALLRSTLEKTLSDNGYHSGSLAKRIDEASGDGIITESRRRRAHEDVRVLGNDVLHDAWRPIASPEVTVACHYAQRILEDFYDDRLSVTAVLFSNVTVVHNGST